MRLYKGLLGEHQQRIALWAGVECTINRVRDAFYDQHERSGHYERLSDLDRIAALGVTALRQAVLWERVAPNSLDETDWAYPDRTLARLAELEIDPIVGLVHHGSGPRYTSLLDPEFPEKLARYAGMVAERYPWVQSYTPVNEPLTTARFSAMYGHWYPHEREALAFAKAVVNQVKGVVLAMREIRKINPAARLVQTDDLGKTHATARLVYQAEQENVRRWLTWDLLCGKVDADHPMWQRFTEDGLDESELAWFLENPCPPDVIGVNYYVTSERFLDHRLHRYPARTRGGNQIERYADVEAVRVLANGCDGLGALLMEAWERFRLPLAVTECHLGCTREEQARWLLSMWDEANAARDAGADVRALTVWSVFGAFDWNSLLCEHCGHYEPGAFDVSSGRPRPTALASVVRKLAQGKRSRQPLYQLSGWWDRPMRLLYPPVISGSSTSGVVRMPVERTPMKIQPLLIVGASGTLAGAFARICEIRNIPVRIVGRAQMDATDRESVRRVFEETRPWAVINTAGYVRVDDAENDVAECFASNTTAPWNLADQCAEWRIPLVTFSSDLVFDGVKGQPYIEDDQPRPLNVYGQSKWEAETQVLGEWPRSLVVRTSAFFGPWDQWNFVYQTLRSVSNGEAFHAATDQVVSPTYVPDLVNAALDLLIDGANGVWHLANRGDANWFDLAKCAARAAGLEPDLIQPSSGKDLGWVAQRPAYSVLSSSRGYLMPSVEDALERFVRECDCLTQPAKTSKYYVS